MPRKQPYQPLLFRSLHAAQGVLALLAMATGYWLLNTWDPMLLQLPLPAAPEGAIDLHEEVGGLFTGAVGVFIVYSLTAGRRRVVQLNTWPKLRNWGKPSSWYALHQITNTGLLLMGVLAVLSGDGVSDDALMAGTGHNPAYWVHVFAWLGMVMLTGCHLLLSVKVGGVPLLMSVVSLTVRPQDSPQQWPRQWQKWVAKGRDWLRQRWP